MPNHPEPPLGAVPLLRREPSADEAALSPVQRAMLFEALRDDSDSSRGYDVLQIHLVLHERLEHERLAAAFTQVVRRHPALASALEHNQDEPRWLRFPEPAVPVRVLDVSRVPASLWPHELQTILRVDRAERFDLSRAPLMRVTLLHGADGSSQLIWTLHHVIVDGVSFAPVLSQVFDTYDRLAQGARPHGEPAAASHDTFMRWLRQRDHAAAQLHFQELLRGTEGPTPLPAAEPASRPLDQQGYGLLERSVEATLWAQLDALAQRLGARFGALLYAAWGIVLARYTGRSDVVFGVTRSLRSAVFGAAPDEQVGLFINTLPMRLQLGHHVSVRELIQQVRTQQQAFRHSGHLHPVDIRSQLAWPPGAPLFETLVTFDALDLASQLRARGARFHDGRCTVYQQPVTPLNLFASGGPQLTLSFQYDRRRFAPDAVARLLDGLLHVLSAMCDEGRALRSIDAIPDSERARIVHTWNATARPFPDQLCIHQLFEARAQEQPDATAVEAGDDTLSYGALNERAQRLAAQLCARGVTPGQRVGVCVARGVDLVVALLAVLKSGGAYVPIDSRYPAARVGFMLNDAACSLLITQRTHRELHAASGYAGPVLWLDDVAVEPERNAPAPQAARADQLAYVIYTSGSTGRPNGVAMTHRAALNTLEWVNRTLRVGPSDRLLFVTSPCFDLSVYDLFGALGAGATVVIARDEELRAPERLYQLLIDKRITIWDSAPAALQLVLAAAPYAVRQSALRLVMLSGDWVPLNMPDNVRATFGPTEVVVLGGATEAAIWSNWYRVEQLDARWKSIPYGRPIQNARYYVLDDRLAPAPIGVPGKLYIGGACLALGYVNRPELTAARFLPDPFLGGDERIYDTGDLARFMDDGNLELLGRVDHQIQVRGYRVELGELEAVLLGMDEVSEALCAAYPDATGQQALSAYVVQGAGGTLDERELRQRLTRLLPEYMLPAHFFFLPALPVTSNGKLDRAALPKPGSLHATSSGAVAPRTEPERALVALWEELLQRRGIGVTDSFFELGGHSLLALTLLRRAQAELACDSSLPRFLERPTVEGMLASAEQQALQLTPALQLYNGRGTRLPLVMVGASQFMLLYRDLAARFPAEQPVYLLQSAAHEQAGTSEHELAQRYDTLLRTHLRGRRAALLGLGAGTAAAAWLAQRLVRRGVDVPLFACIDPQLTATRPHLAPALRLLRQLGELSARAWRGRQPATRAPALPAGTELLVVRSEAAGPLPAELAQAMQTPGTATLRVRGDHLFFLGSEESARVLASLEEALARCSAVPAGPCASATASQSASALA